MPTLHDPTHRSDVRSRLEKLRPDAQGKWGKMRVDQMLWHVASGLDLALGHISPPKGKPPVPLPGPLLRFLVLKAPWPKGAPTVPAIEATGKYDFEAERKRVLSLIDEMAAKDVHAPWPVHPTLGRMSGKQYTMLHGKHVDYHLKQFGA